jgi:hypothetical protein
MSADSTSTAVVTIEPADRFFNDSDVGDVFLDIDLVAANYDSDNVSILKNLSVFNYICRDANSDRNINIGNALHPIACVFKGGSPPVVDCCP